MTREEVIKNLEINKIDDTYVIPDEAIDMAIKALKQEPVFDKIRAEIEQHRRKTQSIDPYDLVGDCLDIIDKYRGGREREGMKEVTLELLIKSLIDDFRDYQKKWLTSHNDVEFDRPEEDLILAFLDDTADSYISEHIS